MRGPRVSDEEEASGIRTRWLSALNAKEQDVDVIAPMAGSHEKLQKKGHRAQSVLPGDKFHQDLFIVWGSLLATKGHRRLMRIRVVDAVSVCHAKESTALTLHMHSLTLFSHL